jgi:transcription initiation factor TFIID subunit 11
MDAVSLASASITGGPKKKKAGRKSKGKENDERARSATANEGAKGKRRASRDKSAEESDEDVGGEETRLLRAKDDKKEDNRKRAMLTQHFDNDQFQRFEAWRSSKLSDATVRRVCQVSILFVPCNNNLSIAC